ncbi:MAG: succinate dehydrogenase, hydrophobic membrane anchor protein [Burkholderiaceae bacterium]
MTSKRIVTGAHYGLNDWLAQRITGIILAVYSIVLFFVWVGSGELTFQSWTGIFSSTWMKVLTLMAMLSLAWHAWIGLRDVYMDYIKPTWIRLTLQVATIVTLVGYAVWTVTILWRL